MQDKTHLFVLIIYYILYVIIKVMFEFGKTGYLLNKPSPWASYCSNSRTPISLRASPVPWSESTWGTNGPMCRDPKSQATTLFRSCMAEQVAPELHGVAEKGPALLPA